MGLSKPVITTSTDISGITTTLAEIKGAVQENSGGTDAPVIGAQFAYLDTKGQTDYAKIISGTGKGKLNLAFFGPNNNRYKVGLKVTIDGVDVINLVNGSDAPDGLSVFDYSYDEGFLLPEIAFSESFNVQVKNTDTNYLYCHAAAYFQ